MYRRTVQGWLKHADFLVLDLITMHLVLVLAYGIRHGALLYTNRDYCMLSILMILSNVFVYLLFNTMKNVLKRGFYIEFRETLRHCFFIFAVTMLFLYVTKVIDNYSRAILLSTLFLHISFG